MSWRDNIERHYANIWGVSGLACPLPEGPLHQLPPDFCVLKFPPHAHRDMWTYATCCMSQPHDEKWLELHMFSPRETDDIVELLTVTAHFHRTGSRLDLGHSVNFGKPWLDTSLCHNGLISRPYLDGPDLENLLTGHREVNFYWLFAVTRAEVDYKLQKGLDALEQKFEAAHFNYLDPARPSVI